MLSRNRRSKNIRGSIHLISVNNSALGQIIGRHLHFHLVARKKTDVEHPHLAGKVSQDFIPAIQLDFEGGCWKQFHNFSVYFQEILGIWRYVFVFTHVVINLMDKIKFLASFWKQDLPRIYRNLSLFMCLILLF